MIDISVLFLKAEKKPYTIEEAIALKPDIYGVTRIKFIVPSNVTYFTLMAFYEDQLNKANTTINAIAFKSNSKKYIQIETSTADQTVNRFAIIHVISNFYMTFFYLIVSGEYFENLKIINYN